MPLSELDQQRFHDRYRQGALFCREVSASIVIEAPIKTVWDILTDFSAYGTWNSFTPEVTTHLEVGAAVEMTVALPGRKTMKRTEWLNRIIPGETLCWGMHMGSPALLTANRWQSLKALEPEVTEYRTADKMSGLLAPLVMLTYGTPMRLGFEQVARDLKAQAEKIYKETPTS